MPRLRSLLIARCRKYVVPLIAVLALVVAGGASAFVFSHASSKVVQPQPRPGSCHVRGNAPFNLPDRHCTPGALNPAVTQATIRKTICRRGYSSRIRPSTSVTGPEKLASMRAYGFRQPARGYEYDHLIPLELSGAANDRRNLWPEPGASANLKDKVENYLHERVCDGRMLLARAQTIIALDWVRFYNKYVKPKPPPPPPPPPPPTTTTTTTTAPPPPPTTTTTTPPPTNTAEPVATGTVATGQTVSVSSGSWANNPTSYSYQWQDCPTDGSACTNISGATSQTYTVQSSQSGDVLRAQVTASNGSGSSSPAASPMIPFGDVFSGSSVDPNVWDIYSRHGDSTQPEPECYVTGNLSEGSNLMTERAEKQTVNPCPYGQGQATTTANYASAETQASTFNFKYGTLKAKIEFSGGTTWPALWMLGSATCEFPNNLDVCPGCGIGNEVDIAEINNNNQNVVDEYDNADANCSFPGCRATVSNVSTNYHVYEFDWTSSQMVFKIDGTTECTIGTGGLSDPIANVPMFPIIDTALNTSYGVTDATLPQTTKVAWIYITTHSPSNVTGPSLTDTTSVGRFLHGDSISVSDGTWGSGMSCGSGGVTCTYEWKRCNPSLSGSGFCSVISGATASTYTLASGDVGDYITASVTASTSNGASSASTPLSIAVS